MVEEDEVHGVTTTPTPAMAPSAPRTGELAVTVAPAAGHRAPGEHGRAA